MTETTLLPSHTADQSLLFSDDSEFRALRDHLTTDGFLHAQQPISWRLASTPFPLSSSNVAFFHGLGHHLLAFYQACNRLYLDSVRGQEPSWIHQYLDQGKPKALLDYARMNRFRDILPDVIRPDVIPTDQGMIMTELDSVPGGIGLTGSLSRAYAERGTDVVGGGNGMIAGFASMIRHRTGDRPLRVAIVVSDESVSYQQEMQWVAGQLLHHGIDAACLHPKDLKFTEEGLVAPGYFGNEIISMIYRFFELFDLPNIPKAELIMYSAKKGRTIITPPFKPWLEEKLAFALFHHPMVEQFWEKALTGETLDVLQTTIPRTWVLDPQPLPPSAIIPGLHVEDRAVSDWKVLGQASQKQRRYVIKPSGFSELAWGSRGVSIGHDLSQAKWIEVIDSALTSFSQTPSILQEFHKGRLSTLKYFDEDHQVWKTMEGRTRLSPYYCVEGDQVTLNGILATMCPKDKKIIHGMRDAIMIPCREEMCA
ncbi:MAG: hypothetical protein GKS05_08740 [Nitrospirales bacterium]|nr:hypothetical protein [Nitrospirales bacterium]